MFCGQDITPSSGTTPQCLCFIMIIMALIIVVTMLAQFLPGSACHSWLLHVDNLELLWARSVGHVTLGGKLRVSRGSRP